MSIYYFRRNYEDLFCKSYKIKISENFKNILKKNDEYYSNINLIKNLNFNDSIWKTINQENQEK